MADIKVKFTAETNDFTAGIDSAMQEIRDLGQTMGATKKQLEDSFRELGRQSFQVGGDKAVEYFKEQVEQSTARVIELAEQLNELQNTDGFDASSEEAKELTASLQEAREQAAQFQAAFVGANEASAEQMQNVAKNGKAIGDALNQIPGPLNGTVGGFRKLITAAKAFIATPIGAIIGALVAALSLLKSYFTGTAEGQSKMAKASAVMGSVLDSIKDVAIKLGKALSEAFDNPAEAVKKLGNAIKKNLMTRLEGLKQQVTALGGMFKSLFSADWDGLKKSAAEYADAQLKIFTGKGAEEWQERTEKMKAWRDEVSATADEMGKLAEREFKLRQQRSKWQVKEAELDNKIAQARMKAYDEDATRGEQAQALAEQQRLITEKYQQQIAFAKEAYDIQKKRNAAHESPIEDLEKENELLANIKQLEAQMNSEMAGVERRRASASKAAREQEFNLLQEAKQLEIQIGEERLKMKDESLNKTLEQIQLDRQRRQIELNTQKHQWETAQGGELTKAQKKYIESMGKLIKEAAATAGETAIFEKYADAAQKAFKQNQISEGEIARLKSEGRTREAAEAERQRNEQALAYMQDVEGGLTPEFKMWIDRLGDYTTKTLESMLASAEEQLTVLKAAGAPQEEIIAAEARIAALNKEVKQAQTDIQRGPKLTAYKNLNKILGDAASGFEALGQTGNEAFDSLMKEIADITSTVQSVIANIQTLVSASIEGMKQGAQEGAKAVKAVEKASVILAIIGAVLSLAIKVSNALGGEHDNLRAIQSEVDDLRNALRDLKREMALDVSGNKSIFGENQLKNLEQYTKATQDYAAEYQKSLEKMSTAWIYTYAERENGRAATLSAKEKESRKRLGESMVEAGYIKPAEDLQSAINQMLDNTLIKTRHKTWFRKEQSDTLRNLLGDVQLLGKTEEETMANLQKFTESDLFGRLSDEQQEAINNMIADWDTYQKALDGVKDTYASFYGDMTNSFAESIKVGFTDGAKAGRQNFKEQVNGMVSDFYLQMRLGERTAEMQERYTQEMLDAKGKGVKDQQSVAIAYADELAKMYDEELAAYEALQTDLENRGYGLKDALDGTLSGAIKGASQESIDLLSGYCNAVRIQQVDGINIMREQLISLSGIQQNTSNTNTILSGFRNDIMRVMETDTARPVGA